MVEAKDVVDLAEPRRGWFDGDKGDWHLLRIAASCTVKIPERGKRLLWQGALRQVVITCVEHHRRRLKA